jgi:hypothetical protein
MRDALPKRTFLIIHEQDQGRCVRHVLAFGSRTRANRQYFQEKKGLFIIGVRLRVRGATPYARYHRRSR